MKNISNAPKRAGLPGRGPALLPGGLALGLLCAWTLLLAWQTADHFPLRSQALQQLFNLSRFGPWQPRLFWLHWAWFLGRLLLLAAWLGAAYGLGQFLLSRLFSRPQAKLEELLESLGLGFAALSLLLFGLGAVGALQAGIFRWIFFPLAAAGAWTAWRRRERLRPGRGWLWNSPPWPDRLLLVLVLSVGAFGVMNASAPELFYDALVYHLGVPSQWLAWGGLVPLPASYFSHLPLSLELLYTGCLLLADERLCRLLHVLLGSLSALTLFAVGRRWLGRRPAFWAAGIFYTIPLFDLNLAEAGVDAGATWFVVLSLLQLLAWREQPRLPNRRLWLAGVFTGAALAAKYNSAFLLAPAALVVALEALRRGPGLKRWFVQVSLFAAGALLLLLPWWTKNTLETGNPVYPFLYRVFPSRSLNVEKIQQQMGEFREYHRRTFAQFLRQPWDLTFMLATNNSYVGTVFLFLLPGFLLLAWTWRRGPPVVRTLLLCAGLAALVWTSQTRIARYFLPVFPVLALLAGWVLERWEKWLRVLGGVARWAVVGFIAWGGLQTAAIAQSSWDPMGTALGLEAPGAYLDRKLMNNYLPMAERGVNILPSSSRVLFFGEARTYYFRRRVTAPTVFDTQPLLVWLEEKPGARAVWEEMRRQGYTHLYLHAQEAVRTRGYEPHRWSEAAVGRLQELLGRYLERRAVLGEQALYQVRPAPDLTLPVKTGRPLYTFDREVVAKVVRHHDQAVSDWTQGRWADVQAQIQRIEQLAPGWEWPYVILGKMEARQQRYAEALRALQTANRLAWLDLDTYTLMGLCALALGNETEGRAYLHFVLARDPNHALARATLAQLENSRAVPVSP